MDSIIFIFKVEKHLNYGESIYIRGGNSDFGNWKESKFKLNWTKGDIWTNEYKILKSSPIIPFKFFYRSNTNKNWEGKWEEIWENGENRLLDPKNLNGLSKTKDGKYILNCVWNNFKINFNINYITKDINQNIYMKIKGPSDPLGNWQEKHIKMKFEKNKEKKKEDEKVVIGFWSTTITIEMKKKDNINHHIQNRDYEYKYYLLDEQNKKIIWENEHNNHLHIFFTEEEQKSSKNASGHLLTNSYLEIYDIADLPENIELKRKQRKKSKKNKSKNNSEIHPYLEISEMGNKNIFIGTSPQSQYDLKYLAEKRIDSIINLLTDKDLKSKNIDHNLLIEKSKELGIIIYRYPIEDNLNEKDLLNTLKKIANEINLLKKEGKIIYIHCRDGKSRSVETFITYLVLYEDYSIKEAIDFCQRFRPGIQINKELINKIETINENYIEKKEDKKEDYNKNIGKNNLNSINNEINSKNNNIINEKKYNKINNNFNENLSFSIKKKFTEPPKIGLQNVGATCYMNATIQCLCQIEKLVNYFKSNPKIDKIIKEYKNDNKVCLTESFKYLIENLWPTDNKYYDKKYNSENTNNKYFIPSEFKEKISEMNPLFQGVKANDSKDLVNFIIMTLHSELNEGKKYQDDFNPPQENESEMLKYFTQSYFHENKSIICDLFYGINGKIYQCSLCNVQKYNFQVFFFLIFPLEEVRKFKIGILQQQLMQQMQQMQLMQMNNQNNIYMNNINNINNPMFYLQAMNNLNNINCVKINDCFDYYRKIDIMDGENAMYCNNCQKLCKANYSTYIVNSPEILIIILNRGKGIEFNVKLEFGEYLNIQNYVKEQNVSNNYKLIGVVSHFGENSESGHFIAYCKSPIDGYWYKYNDDSVTSVNDFQKEIIDFAMPYILFYQRM